MKQTSENGSTKPKKTLLDFFKPSAKQIASSSSNPTIPSVVEKIHCPACSELVSAPRINWHLDSDCSSRVKKPPAKKRNSKKSKASSTKTKKKVAAVVLSDSDDDFVNPVEKNFNSSLLKSPSFDSPSIDTRDSVVQNTRGDESFSGVFISESMLEVNIDEESLKGTSPSSETRSPGRIRVKCASALLVEEMLNDDWNIEDILPAPDSDKKRKTFDLNCPSTSFKSNSLDATNKKAIESVKPDQNGIKNVKSTPIEAVDFNLTHGILDSPDVAGKDSESSESDDFQEMNHSFRTPSKQVRKSHSSQSKSASKHQNKIETSPKTGNDVGSRNNSNPGTPSSCRSRHSMICSPNRTPTPSPSRSTPINRTPFSTPKRSPNNASPIVSSSHLKRELKFLENNSSNSSNNNNNEYFSTSPSVRLSPCIKRNMKRFGISNDEKISPTKTSANNSPNKNSRKNLFRERSKTVSPQKMTPNASTNSSPAKLDLNNEKSPLNSHIKEKKDYRDVNGLYLENFLKILDSVCSSNDFKLFNDEDRGIIETFSWLSLQAKKLYVRLFLRKLEWKRVNKLDYQDICDKEDIFLYIRELHYGKYLHLEDELNDVEIVLQMLGGDEVTSLAKCMKITTTGKNKAELIQILMRNSKQQPTIFSAFSKSSSSSGGSLLLKKAKSLLSEVCHLNRQVRRIFSRVLTLFSLPRYDEDDENGQQPQLVALLRINIGQTKFPSGVPRFRENDIFSSREDLINFERCQELCTAVRDKLDGHNWSETLNICDEADQLYQELSENQSLLSHDESLPSFLRKFTSMSVLTYLRACRVEALQKLRRYAEAVQELNFLLGQKTYRQDYRGTWYDRLALNLDQHLKKHDEALQVIVAALRDPEVRGGFRLSLSIRGQKLAANRRPKSKKSKKVAEEFQPNLGPPKSFDGVEFLQPREAPKVIIKGRSFELQNGSGTGFKRIFLRGDSAVHSGEGEVVACSVEELVLGHYKSLGYSEGLHAEGSTVNSIYGLLFWDILYEIPIPDVFRVEYQTVPLDLDYGHFYASRKEAIDNRVLEVAEMNEESLSKMVENVWQNHFEETSIVRWDLFKSPKFAVDLILSLGLQLVSKVCERLAKDHRFTRSGFPDLIVWNADQKISRIVEVKGPNDRLSTKQILWLEYLLNHGSVAEVCHVEAIGAKNMQPNSPTKPPKSSPKKGRKNHRKPDKEEDDDFISDAKRRKIR